ncbi:MAG TPA: hypothetical protein VMO78_18130 [Rhizomicrobium sp.]|nr:hypothetical protein [Rhizomicrobium sp.]
MPELRRTSRAFEIRYSRDGGTGLCPAPVSAINCGSRQLLKGQSITVSATEAREAEHEARKQRIGFAHHLRADESKVASAASLMHLRRIVATAMERSVSYDHLLSEPETQRLFSVGALFFAREGE